MEAAESKYKPRYLKEQFINGINDDSLSTETMKEMTSYYRLIQVNLYPNPVKFMPLVLPTKLQANLPTIASMLIVL